MGEEPARGQNLERRYEQAGDEFSRHWRICRRSQKIPAWVWDSTYPLQFLQNCYCLLNHRIGRSWYGPCQIVYCLVFLSLVANVYHYFVELRCFNTTCNALSMSSAENSWCRHWYHLWSPRSSKRCRMWTCGGCYWESQSLKSRGQFVTFRPQFSSDQLNNSLSRSGTLQYSY